MLRQGTLEGRKVFDGCAFPRIPVPVKGQGGKDLIRKQLGAIRRQWEWGFMNPIWQEERLAWALPKRTIPQDRPSRGPFGPGF